LAGNDDCGTLSAWYIFFSSGFYPSAGQDKYWLTGPVFERVVFKMSNGKQLEVVAKNAGSENIYIQDAKLNNEPLLKTWFTHSDIANGGKLEFEMGQR
jgi:putative alpha-1,2-mannosidase